MIESNFKKTLFSYSLFILLSLSLLLSLSSCKSGSSYFSSISTSDIDTFQNTSSDQKWVFYKEFFHKGASWDKVIHLNDKTIIIKYEIIDFNPDSDSYTVQVSSNGKTKTYIQNKESFLSDLTSISNLSSKQSTTLKETQYLNYDVVEITTSDLEEEELIAILPDLKGITDNIQSIYLNIFLLPKEGFPLKTQITITTQDKTIDFTTSVENLKLQ